MPELRKPSVRWYWLSVAAICGALAAVLWCARQGCPNALGARHGGAFFSPLDEWVCPAVPGAFTNQIQECNADGS